jgi:hypothetical protein
MGFFGYQAKHGKQAAQPLHAKVVDIDEALADASVAVGLWFRSLSAPNAPALSGGCLDAWPAAMLDAFAVCRSEEMAVEAYLAAEARHG